MSPIPGVATGPSVEDVITAVDDELIVAGPSVDDVVASATVEGVVAVLPEEPVSTVAPGDDVVAVTAVHDVVSVACIDDVVSSEAEFTAALSMYELTLRADPTPGVTAPLVSYALPMQPLLVLTIGQAPRHDIVAELADILGERPVHVMGALDGLTLSETDAFPPTSPRDTLHTRLADGTDVVVSKAEITIRLSKLIDEAGGRPILVACTGRFSGLPERAGILYPSEVLHNLVDAVLPAGGRLGVLVPLEAQVAPFRDEWSATGRPTTVVAVTPGHDPTDAASALRDAEVDIVVLDCFGYSRSTLQMVRELTGRPVLSAVRCTAHLASELLG